MHAPATPMMAQYFALKQQAGDCLLFSSQTRQGVEDARDHIDAWLGAK